MSTAPARPITAEELLFIPEEGKRCDLFHGELVWTSPMGLLDGATAARIGAAIGNHVEARGLGATLVGTGFILGRDPDTVLGPDVSFVRSDRLPLADPDFYVPGPPDLAVEIIRPDDTAAYVIAKVDAYLAAGTPVLWVVEPRRRIVLDHRASELGREFRSRDLLDGGDVLPDFRLPVADIVR